MQPTSQISTAGLCNGDFAFTADGTGLYYVRPDENHRPSAVWLHRLGRDAGDDRLIWHEADPAYFVSLERQASSDAAGGVILLHLHDHAASEYRLLSACPDDRQQAGEQEETVPCIFSRRQVVSGGNSPRPAAQTFSHLARRSPRAGIPPRRPDAKNRHRQNKDSAQPPIPCLPSKRGNP